MNTDKTKARENNCQNTMESYAKSNNKNEEVTMMPQITSMISNRNISLVKTEATTEGPNVQENNDPLYIGGAVSILILFSGCILCYVIARRNLSNLLEILLIESKYRYINLQIYS